MSYVQNLIHLFHANGDRLTLRQLRMSFDLIGSNETGRISDARVILLKEGKDIVQVHEDREHPGNNTYAIVKVKEENGQMLMGV